MIEAIGLTETINHLQKFRKKMETRKVELIGRLAEIGIEVARAEFMSAQYDGTNDVEVGDVVWESKDKAYIVASGTKVLFIEFGTGAMYGYGHPKAAEFGYGPGTWSDNEELGGKHHWDDPNGWYYSHGQKSFGNPPARAMYYAGRRMHLEVTRIAKEVFHD